jgi:glycosyltransferase involved in cell wall biosynthesis
MPLTVLHCRSSFARHGPEQAMGQLLPALPAYSVTPCVLALYRAPAGGPQVNPWVEEMRRNGIAAEQIADPGPLSLGVVRRLRREILACGADVLHTHDYKTNILGGLAARRADRSLAWVATVHLHTTTTSRLRMYRALDLFLLRLADRVVTVSREQRRMLLRRGVDRRRLVLVPNVIGADAFAAMAAPRGATRAALGLADDVPLVVLVGRLTSQKGVDVLLTAASAVVDVRPSARFLIAGAGPDQAALQAQASSLSLGDAVLFLGYRSDVPSLMAAADVIAVPSRAEGLPLVVLEAMALARPVVAARVGGVPDVVRHGETGFLVTPDAPVPLAERLLELLDDPALATRMGDAGARLVRARYGPDQAARRMSTVYRTVVAERR